MHSIITSKLGNKWRVTGINMIPEDSAYIRVLEAINDWESGNGDALTQRALMKGVRHMTPVEVDTKKRDILFCRW